MDIAAEAEKYFKREDIRSQAARDLADIIAIPSVAAGAEGGFPYGHECARALDLACAKAEKYGFRYENHEYHCVSVLYGESEREVGIITHLDVVPAGEGWETDPFRLTERDGLFIGRGAHDDKGPFIQSLYTLRFLKENNIKLPFAVRLILGSDEEVGSSDLQYFKSVRRAPDFSFTPDSEYPVCIGEKGLLSVDVTLCALPKSFVSLSGGTVSNAVPFEANAVIRSDKALLPCNGISVERDGDCVKIKAKGLAAHAASPENGVNAIALLADYILANGLADGAEKGFSFLSSACGEYLGRTLGIACSNDDFGYLTCIGGVLGQKDGMIVQNFNIRYLPEMRADEVLEKISEKLAPTGFSIKKTSSSEGYFVSSDDERIKALTNACESVLGIPCEPYTMGGGTYARSLPNTVAFGAGIDSERDHLGSARGGAHQRDEYISEKEFFSGMNIFVRSLLNLSSVMGKD